MEGDEVSVGVEYRELLVPPRRVRQRRVGMNDAMPDTLREQRLDALDTDSASGGFRDPPVGTGPEMNADGTIRHDAIGTLFCMNPGKAQARTEELDASTDVQ